MERFFGKRGKVSRISRIMLLHSQQWSDAHSLLNVLLEVLKTRHFDRFFHAATVSHMHTIGVGGREGGGEGGGQKKLKNLKPTGWLAIRLPRWKGPE